jgi:hypothetical protein
MLFYSRMTKKYCHIFWLGRLSFEYDYFSELEFNLNLFRYESGDRVDTFCEKSKGKNAMQVYLSVDVPILNLQYVSFPPALPCLGCSNTTYNMFLVYLTNVTLKVF